MKTDEDGLENSPLLSNCCGLELRASYSNLAMSLTHFFYEPFYSASDFDRIFDEAFAARGFHGNQVERQHKSLEQGLGVFKPRMDLRENPNGKTVTATFEMPGLKKEEIEIDMHNGLLTVSGETKSSSDKEEGGYAVRERRYGKFSRTVKLPQGIKEDEIKASMENGVLTVTFPKSAPELAPKKITVS